MLNGRQLPSGPFPSQANRVKKKKKKHYYLYLLTVRAHMGIDLVIMISI